VNVAKKTEAVAAARREKAQKVDLQVLHAAGAVVISLDGLRLVSDQVAIEEVRRKLEPLRRRDDIELLSISTKMSPLEVPASLQLTIHYLNLCREPGDRIRRVSTKFFSGFQGEE
jgi:hypothetical protein